MAQYDGAGEVKKRFEKAKSDLQQIYYKGNEAVFPFTKFAAKLQAIFIEMREAGRPKSEQDQVDALLEKMQVSHHLTLQNIKMDAARRYPNDFTSCITWISSEISQHVTTPPSNTRNPWTRLISEVHTDNS